MADDDVQGVVSDANGDPIEGATVYALRTDTTPPEFVGEATTDPSGFYQIGSNFDGQVHVVAEWQSGASNFSSRSRPFVPVSQVGLTEINNYLEDDWEDNNLTGRNSPDDGVYAHPDANVAGDVLIGRYRPEWNLTQDSGTLTLSGGDLVFDLTNNSNSTRDMIITPTSFTVGSWRYDTQLQENNGTTGVRYRIITDVKNAGSAGDSGSSIEVEVSGGFIGLLKHESGTQTVLIDANNSISDTNVHSSELIRDSYGDYELFFDGTSQGTSTDTFIPEVKYTMFYSYDSNGDTEVQEVDNLVIQ